MDLDLSYSRVGGRIIEGAYMFDRTGVGITAHLTMECTRQFVAGGMDIAGYAPTNIGDIIYKGR
jgi:hypothetical protein